MPKPKKTITNIKRKKNEMIELSQGKSRKEEEQFLTQFSGNQLNAVLLIVLSATFIVQGVLRYLEAIDKLGAAKVWFFIVIMSFFFLISSVVTIILSNVLAPLRSKRHMSVISFVSFLVGVLFFFSSLIYLLFIL